MSRTALTRRNGRRDCPGATASLAPGATPMRHGLAGCWRPRSRPRSRRSWRAACAQNLLSMNFGIFETGRRLEWVYLMAADARRRAGEPFGPYTAAEATERWNNVERGKYIWWLPLDDIPASAFSTLNEQLKAFHRAQNKEFMRFGEIHEQDHGAGDADDRMVGPADRHHRQLCRARERTGRRICATSIA